MSYCKNYQVLGVGVGQSDTQLSRLRCKQWSCDYCAYINRVQWHMRVMRTMENNPEMWPFALMTVTAPRWAHKEKKTLRVMQDNANKMLQRIKYHNRADDFAYVRVYEQHESGEWHAHYLITWYRYRKGDEAYKKIIETDEDLNYANTRFLKKHMAETGHGWKVDWRIIRTDYDPNRGQTPVVQSALQVVSYVTKYMTKSTQTQVQRHRYKRMRQIQATRHFKPEYATCFEDGEKRRWRVQGRYRYKDYLKDVKPVKDAQTGQHVGAASFLERQDNVYPDLLMLEAAERIDRDLT
jgi:hypothetical protein